MQPGKQGPSGVTLARRARGAAPRRAGTGNGAPELGVAANLHRFGALSVRHVVVGLLLAFLAWQVVALTAWGYRRPPGRLLAISPSATALVPLAENRLGGSPTAEDLADAARMAGEALSRSPLTVEAIRILGLIAAMQGEDAKALALLSVAGERSLRDAPAQAWLADHALRSGDFRTALERIDVLLRAQPTLGDEVLPALLALAADPAGRGMLADTLAGSPPWRGEVMKRLATAPDPMLSFALVAELKARSAPLSTDELRPYLQRLVKDGLYERAYVLWAQSLPPDELVALGPVQNGGFERPVSNLPFDWSFGRIAGATVEIDAPPGPGSTRALKVEFNWGRVPFRHVSQTLLLAPGKYELHVRGRAEDLQSDRGLWWVVYCGERTRIGETQTIRGTAPWTVMRAEFEVPAKGCPVQRIRLELAARIAIEQQVDGRAWFDDVAISRLDGSATGPSANAGG